MAITVSDFMTRQVITVTPDDRLHQAAERMQARGCRRLPVVEDDRLVGIISDSDVRLALASPFVMRERWYDDKLLDETPVRACMSLQVEVVSPDTPLYCAAMLMRDNKIGGLPVTEKDRLVGIITETDMLNALIQLLMVEPVSTESSA
jgi:acetoin utilization protein AcuB